MRTHYRFGIISAEHPDAENGLNGVDESEISMSDQRNRPEAQEYIEAAKSAPEVRHGRVQELKRQIERGEYHIDSRKIADKLLERRPEDDPF